MPSTGTRPRSSQSPQRSEPPGNPGRFNLHVASSVWRSGLRASTRNGTGRWSLGFIPSARWSGYIISEAHTGVRPLKSRLSSFGEQPGATFGGVPSPMGFERRRQGTRRFSRSALASRWRPPFRARTGERPSEGQPRRGIAVGRVVTVPANRPLPPATCHCQPDGRAPSSPGLTLVSGFANLAASRTPSNTSTSAFSMRSSPGRSVFWRTMLGWSSF